MEKSKKFDYGETVKISENAPKKYHSSEVGFVCGMIDIDSIEAATAFYLKTPKALN